MFACPADRGNSTLTPIITPLWKKLGIKPGARVCVANAPPQYGTWVSPLPEGAAIVSTAGKAGCDIVHIFVDTRAGFERELRKARTLIRSNGAIWVSWPKKSARIPADLDENAIRDTALKTDLVDVKVCAVTEIWSGLKLVVRTHLRG
jgi:hypothetical protein